ncbi:response regulator [Pleurocapsales cyanobacterium LEGE 06147]|nr:response regulator [Pleurocapsales cyanobacterium LEGE 06147]
MSCILIAEDEERLAAFIDKGLRKYGYETAIAFDGEQAVQMAASGRYHLLLLDLGLPVKDGWTVLAQLQQIQKSLPTIIVTARNDPQDRLAGLQAGVIDYVTKPFSFKDLLARIQGVLS